MAPKKDTRDTNENFDKDIKKNTVKKSDEKKNGLGQKIKNAFLVNSPEESNKAPKPISDKKTASSAAEHSDTKAPIQNKKLKPSYKRPIAQTSDSKSKHLPQEEPSEETVVFSDDVTKQFSNTLPTGKKRKSLTDSFKAVPKKELTQPVPIVGKRSLFKPRDKKPNFAIGVILTTIKMSFVAIVIAIAIGLGSFLGVANAYLGATPELDIEKIQNQSENSKIYDGDGSELAVYTGLENREWVSIEEIPVLLQKAVIDVEDIRFEKHNGVDFRRLMGAFVSNLSRSTSEGGSTITQQLVKNELLTSERSYKRKLQEAYLATELEKTYTKDQILEAYLNAIPLGGTVYGVKSASKDYFGKELSQLNLKEMICLASITQNPTKYNPRRSTYTKTENLAGLINRMNIVAERMYWNGDITKEQYDEVVVPSEVYLSPECLEQDSDGKWKLKEDSEIILNESYLDTWKSEMNILEESPANSLYQYPHFIEYLIYDVQNFMMEKEGLEKTKENRAKVDLMLRTGGYKIYATIDPSIQETVQSTFSEWDKYPKMDPKIESDGTEVIQPQTAAVVIENTTGQLKAIVGSRTTPDKMKTLNRAYMGKKQVGSSIKPLAVYGPAFELGYGSGSYVPYIKQPITGWITGSDGSFGFPKFQGSMPEGPVTIKDAIVNSLNIAAAQTIMNYVGIDESVNYLHKLGVSEESLEGTMTGSGLSMGGSNITPIEMAGAYSTIARGGTYKQPVSFSKVFDSNNDIYIDTDTDREVHTAFKESTCYMLTDSLMEAVQSGTGKNARLDGMTTAGKTGTNADNKGVYFAGYTPYYTSTLWLGNDDNAIGMSSSSVNTSAPLWKAYMQKIHENKSDKPFSIMEKTAEEYGLIEAQVCKYSNKKPMSGCSTVTALMPADSPLLNEECDVCESSYSDNIKMCGISGMRFVEGVCPEESAYFYPVYRRTFAEDSPYANWRSTSGVYITESTENEDGTVTYGENPTAACTHDHLADIVTIPPDTTATPPENFLNNNAN